MNVYCKGALPESCKVESNGLILQAKIVHAFGAKETLLNYELFGRIDVEASKVTVFFNFILRITLTFKFS